MTATAATEAASDSIQVWPDPGRNVSILGWAAGGYYAYRQWGSFGQGALDPERRKFALKKEGDVTVICPACGIDLQVPRLGTMQLVVCDNCGNEGEMEV